MLDDATEGNLRQYMTPAASYQIEKLPDRLAIDSSTFAYRIITVADGEVTSVVRTFNTKEVLPHIK